jgi:hypothetical protein
MGTPGAQPRPLLPPIRPDWLDRSQEEILEPDLPIVDPHHRQPAEGEHPRQYRPPPARGQRRLERRQRQAVGRAPTRPLDSAPPHPHLVAQGQRLDLARSFDAHTW